MKYKSEFILIIATLIWGITFPLTKGVLYKTPPFLFLSMRFFLAALIFIFFFAKLKFSKENIKWGIVIGLFLFFGMSTQTVGLMFTKASKSGFITNFLVFLIPILNYIFFRKKPSKNAIIGVILSITGLYLLSRPESGGFNFGDFLTFLSAIFFALQVIFIEYATTKFDEITIVSIEVFTTFFLSTATTLSFEKKLPIINFKLIVAVVITGVFATSIAFLLQGKYQKETTPTRAGIIYSLEPAFAMFFSYLILGEKLPEKGIIGALLILSGLIISSIKKKF